MHNDTITLFNRVPAKGGGTWYATVIHGVNLNIDKASIMAKYGADTRDSVVLNVPYDVVDGVQNVAGKPWKPPKEWQALEDHTAAVTFTDGNLFDFFMLGEWDGNPVIADKEYPTNNGFYDYMNRTRDYVFAVSSVGLYTVIPHFEIMGK